MPLVKASRQPMFAFDLLVPRDCFKIRDGSDLPIQKGQLKVALFVYSNSIRKLEETTWIGKPQKAVDGRSNVLISFQEGRSEEAAQWLRKFAALVRTQAGLTMPLSSTAHDCLWAQLLWISNTCKIKRKEKKRNKNKLGVLGPERRLTG